MKLVLFVFILGVVHVNFCNAMTEAQMKAAIKLIRNVCQPKAKATDAQITAMHNGDWNQDKSGMQLPDNTFDWETGVKTVEALAPPSIGSFASDAIKNCKDAVKTLDDKCRAALEISKCLYDFNPEKYFLP